MPGDQIEIRLPKTQFDERSSFTADVDIKTRSTGLAATPTTIHYRIDNLSTRTAVADWTSVSPASSVEITVKSGENRITGGVNFVYGGFPKWETLQLMVAIDQGLDTEVINAVHWRTHNLYGVN